MKRYEFVREIFYKCSGNPMRNVLVEEVEVGDLADFVKSYLIGAEVSCERSVNATGAIIYDIKNDGLAQRLTFTQICLGVKSASGAGNPRGEASALPPPLGDCIHCQQLKK